MKHQVSWLSSCDLHCLGLGLEITVSFVTWAFCFMWVKIWSLIKENEPPVLRLSDPSATSWLKLWEKNSWTVFYEASKNASSETMTWGTSGVLFIVFVVPDLRILVGAALILFHQIGRPSSRLDLLGRCLAQFHRLAPFLVLRRFPPSSLHWKPPPSEGFDNVSTLLNQYWTASCEDNWPQATRSAGS